MRPHPSELVLLVVHGVSHQILLLLIVGGLLLVVSTDHRSDRGWGTICSPERRANLPNINAALLLSPIDKPRVTWPSQSDSGLDLPELGLLEASGHLIGCSQLVEPSEIFVIEGCCLLGFIFILPVRCNCLTMSKISQNKRKEFTLLDADRIPSDWLSIVVALWWQISSAWLRLANIIFEDE
jgi:hypothetical protein